MGLFDRDEDSAKEEVRVDVRDSGSSKKETRLKKEVNSKVAGSDSDSAAESSSSSSRVTTRSTSSRSSSTNSSISMEDIHGQNEKIIELLEQLTEDDSSSRSRSSPVRDRNSSDDDGVRGDMGELL